VRALRGVLAFLIECGHVLLWVALVIALAVLGRIAEGVIH